MTCDHEESPDSEDENLIGCGTCHAVWSDDPEAVPNGVEGKIVVYTNKHGWRLELGPRYFSVWDANEDFVMGWDLGRMTFVEYSEDIE